MWWGLSRLLPLWPDAQRPQFAQPWREVGIVLLAVVGTLLLGQLWVRGIRLNMTGPWAPVGESINQIIIFAPVIAVPILRRQGWASAWIRLDRIAMRLVIGLLLALVALLLYSTLERGAASWPDAVREMFAPSRSHVAVQVLLEDVAIAILFVRVAAAMGPRGAILIVAALFAVAHIPSMIARGDTTAELVALLRDAGLAMLVVGTAWRSADIAWLWPVHYALDMTQFLGRAT
jgi:hypothetical protein